MQKRILVIEDMAGFGRSSLVPVIGVLSAMGHQCVPLPTAFYSSHLGLAGWHMADLTDAMRPALGQYRALGIRFDGICVGFLASPAQAGVVLELAGSPLWAWPAVVDPVLGDHGRLYKSVTPAQCEAVKELCKRAHVLTPNQTEAALLLGKPLDAAPRNAEEAGEWACTLAERYGAQVVLTGLAFQEGEATIVYAGETGATGAVSHPRIGGGYPGTGDIFTAVLAGALVGGESLREAALRAGRFVMHCIAYTEQQGTAPAYGVQFEPQLYRLSPKTDSPGR